MNMVGRWRSIATSLAFVLATTTANAGPPQSLPAVAEPFQAADFSLPDEAGTIYRLSAFRGKWVVLNFWATWCPPCRYEMPSMERAHQALRDDNIVLLGINVGQTADEIFAFTGQYPVTFPLPIDRDGTVVKRYPVVGLPTTFIIDPQGRVTHRAVGGREWDDAAVLAQLRQLSRQ